MLEHKIKVRGVEKVLTIPEGYFVVTDGNVQIGDKMYDSIKEEFADVSETSIEYWKNYQAKMLFCLIRKNYPFIIVL